MANRSTFPTTIDSFIEHLEMSASDKTSVQRYQQLKLLSSRTPAEDDELATLTTQLRSILMTAEDFNKLQDAITNTQTFFRDNVDGYIQTKQTEFQAEVDKFTHKGEYNPTVQYYKKNTVSLNGESYVCLQDVLGTAPDPLTNTTYWAKIAQRGAKGEQGIAGTGLRFKGAYNISTQYFADDAVQFGGQIFACLQDNIGQQPNPDAQTTYWALAVAKGSSTKVTTLRNTVNVLNTTSNVSIGIPEYNSVTDELIVIKNTATLAKGINYSINANGASIDSLEGIWDGTQYPITFHFIVLKNFVTDLTFDDGNMIQDGTVSKAKLKVELQDEITGKANTIDVDNKIGVLTDDLANHVNNYMPHDSKLNSYASIADVNGVYTVVDFKRTDGTLYLKSTLSNPDTNGYYQTVSWDFYGIDGITIVLPVVWTVTYDAIGNIISKVVA